jgi:excisionase family DNA binding protein
MSETVSSEIPFFTLGEAAKQAGVSKPTLSKAIKTGRISAEKQPDGSYRIQPAELFRVYPPETHGNGLDRSEFVERETGKENRLVAEQVGVLRERLALLTDERERERQQLTDQIEDLRRRLDAEADARRLEGEERRKLTALLTDQRPKDETPSPNAGRGFWARLRGRA